ncbi:MAG: DUF2283 domain-containing protein [Dehalococcoidia bacterium]|nr:DUF2283 domain-containing protein [Dehalococcoidia bacterium]
MTTLIQPMLDLAAIRTIEVDYDAEDDLAIIHINGPRPAVTEQVDDGWYLRVAELEVVGIELHGLVRMFLSLPWFARVARPALTELEAYAGQPLARLGRVSAASGELPATTHLLIFLIGQAIGRLHDEQVVSPAM